MRINQKQKHTKLKAIAASAIAVIIIGGVVFAWYSPDVPFFGNKTQDVRPENTVDYNKTTDDQKKAGEDKKKSTATPNSDIKPTTPSSDGNPNIETDSFVISITALNVSDGVVQVRSLIDIVSSEGFCDLVVTKGSAKVTKQSDIQAGPHSSTCMGFDFPVSELSPGVWDLTITAEIGSNKDSATQTLTVQ